MSDDVNLIATRDFSYQTRRLKAGEAFTVRAGVAKVLVGIGKAEAAREPGKVAAPPARVVKRAAAAAPAKKAAPKNAAPKNAAAPRKRAPRKGAAKK